MAMKEWFRRLQPVQLYLMLTLTVTFFITELIVSHITHALTLLVDSYHMLCNIIALTGCIITIKYGRDSGSERKSTGENANGSTVSFGEELSTRSKKSASSPLDIIPAIQGVQGGGTTDCSSQEKRLKNTFGWARIDVIVMLICFVFLASLCFSLLVEALQTLVHIDHHDEMHHPIPVLIVGASGLVLNGICYLIIGGYTFHQGSFLHVTASGDVVLDRVVTNDSVKRGQRRLSRTRALPITTTYTPRQGAREMARDVLGCVYVIICSLLVYYTENPVAKFVDPIVSMISAISLLWLSYPYMKESGLILLQTIPDTINIDSLKSELLAAFPDIVSVHDLHVWQLTATKVISTAHIIFQDPKVYARITKDVSDFFISQGITQVTVQPEFSAQTPKLPLLAIAGSVPDVATDCLMQCRGEECTLNHCCAHHKKDEQRIHKRWSTSKEIIPSNSTIDLKSIRVDEREFRSASSVDNPGNGYTNSIALGAAEDSTLSKSVQDLSQRRPNGSMRSKYDSMKDLPPACDADIVTETTVDQKVVIEVEPLEEAQTTEDADKKVDNEDACSAGQLGV